MDRLQKQLESEYRNDAEDCIKIYNNLKKLSNGHVWESDWRTLVRTIFEGFPSDNRRFKPTSIGYIYLKGIETE